MRPSIFVVLLTLGCAPSSDATDTGSAGGQPVTLTITSPKDGATFEWDEDVSLEVSAKQGREEVKLGAVTWTLGDLDLHGESATASNLDAGDYDVEVDAVVDGEHYTESVSITVDEKPKDTGGGDTGHNPGDTVYAGTMSSHVWYDGQFGKFDGECPGTVNVTIATDNQITGTGYCNLDGQYDMNYTLDGKLAGDNTISGNLTANVDGTEYKTPYDGKKKGDGSLTASYDKTFKDGGDSLRIQGTWDATEQ